MRRQRDTGHWYVSLHLGPGNHNFPVYDPHISIGVFSFESYTNMWMAWIEMSSLLFSRQVVGHFGRHGIGMNFLVLPGCELFALICLLREKATRHSTQSRNVRDPHITWHLLEAEHKRITQKVALKYKTMMHLLLISYTQKVCLIHSP